MYPDPYLELGIPSVRYDEGAAGGDQIQGHRGDVTGVLLTIGIGNSGHHHVWVNRGRMQLDKFIN